MDLSELKEVWRETGFRPRKSLGQNFLIDKNVRNNILDAFSLDENEAVIEIGAGFGVMSFEAARKSKRLFAVEKDDRIAEIMAPRFQGAGNITFIHGDILNVNLGEVSSSAEKVLVIGNIPYCISTPVMEHIIKHRLKIRAAYLVIQEELADRVVSPPGSKVYGSLSCFIQYYMAAKRLFRISKNCFSPQPKVSSCLLELKVLDKPSVAVDDEAMLFKVIRAAFSQRRKKAVNPLAHSKIIPADKQEWAVILKKCNIDPAARAESLSLQNFADITNVIIP